MSSMSPVSTLKQGRRGAYLLTSVIAAGHPGWQTIHSCEHYYLQALNNEAEQYDNPSVLVIFAAAESDIRNRVDETNKA